MEPDEEPSPSIPDPFRRLTLDTVNNVLKSENWVQDVNTYPADPRWTRNDFENFADDYGDLNNNAGPRLLQNLGDFNLAGFASETGNLLLGSMADAVGKNLYDYNSDPVIPSASQRMIEEMERDRSGNGFMGPIQPLEPDLYISTGIDFGPQIGVGKLMLGVQERDYRIYNPENSRFDHRDDFAAALTLKIPLGGARER